MQATLLLIGFLPPPSSRAGVIARLDGPGTWCAANAYKTFVVQWVIGYIILSDKINKLFLFPMQQWVKLKNLVAFVPFKLLHAIAAIGMFGSYAGNPNRHVLQSTLKRFYFSYIATLLAKRHCVVKSVGAIIVDK